MSHEAIDAHAKPLWVGLAITVVATLVGLAATYLLLREGRPRAQPERWYMHAPREVNEIEAAPFTARTDAEDQAEAAHQRMKSYGWVDREQRIVHVPIDIAYDLYLRGRQ